MRPGNFADSFRQPSSLRWRKPARSSPPFGGWPIRRTAARDAWESIRSRSTIFARDEKSVAEQIEAAHKAGLAKAEVGIREKKPVPTLREFIDNDFAPFVESRLAGKAKKLEYYRIGLKNLREFEPLASSLLIRLDSPAEKTVGPSVLPVVQMTDVGTRRRSMPRRNPDLRQIQVLSNDVCGASRQNSLSRVHATCHKAHKGTVAISLFVESDGSQPVQPANLRGGEQARRHRVVCNRGHGLLRYYVEFSG
jgi:hypothetical protein